MQQTTRPPTAAIPRKLKLFIIEFGGLAVMGVGVWLLVTGNPVGLLVVVAGVDLLLRPGARRKLPRGDRVLLKLVDRWRPPPQR